MPLQHSDFYFRSLPNLNGMTVSIVAAVMPAHVFFQAVLSPCPLARDTQESVELYRTLVHSKSSPCVIVNSTERELKWREMLAPIYFCLSLHWQTVIQAKLSLGRNKQSPPPQCP